MIEFDCEKPEYKIKSCGLESNYGNYLNFIQFNNEVYIPKYTDLVNECINKFPNGYNVNIIDDLNGYMSYLSHYGGSLYCISSIF